VDGGAGDLAEIARCGITWAFGRCEEMHAQLAWMCDWNTANEHPVGFYGMDIPGWCTDPAPAVAACLNRLPARPGDRELLAAAELGEPTTVPLPRRRRHDRRPSRALERGW
ncbi:MAG: erythromycin esterase family protein, partial [Pseudonocardiaceae bacterium]